MARPPVRYLLDPDDSRVLEALAPLNERQREFTLVVCQGESYAEAYSTAYGSDRSRTAGAASRLANKPHVAEARRVIREIGETAARAAALMSAFERRELCARVARDDTLDPAFRALVLALPSEHEITQCCVDAGMVPDPTQIHETRKALADRIAGAARDTLEAIYNQMVTAGSYSSDPVPSGKRALRNTALRLLTPLDGPARARAHYDTATNMTDQLAAFACLLDAGDTEVAVRFHDQWQHDRLVLDKWFMLQVAHAKPQDAVKYAKSLSEHIDFDWKNPNRFRSVIGGLTATNPAGFHDPSGAGYAFLADWLLRLDAINPQTAARMSTAFETWRLFDVDRQALIEEQLRRIAGADGLSRDLTEMVGRMMAG